MFEERPIVGHVRFSFYGLTDTRSKPGDDGAALAALYDETRMARRFFLFENLTLPSLIAQTDRAFRTVIMSSEVMPDRFKDRLFQVAARLPGALVDFSPWTRGDRAFRQHMLAPLGPDRTGTAVHFRLDDDDAVSTSYIARLRRISGQLPPGTHITFPTGLFAFPADPARAEGASILHQHFLGAQGLAIVSGPGFLKNPFQMMHGNVWRRWPVVSDPGFPAYIRTWHDSNDTAARQDGLLAEIRRERFSRRAARHAAEVEETLAQHFPFLTRERLDGLIPRVDAIRSLSDLPPA